MLSQIHPCLLEKKSHLILKLRKEARERYQNLSEEEKDKRCKYGCEWYRNLSEKEKEKKLEYGREQYKNLLEDEHKNVFLECRKYLSINHFLGKYKKFA